MKSNLIILMLLGGMLTGCRHSQSGATAAELSDSIPDEVRKVILAVENSDTDGFAGRVSYPLSRPYPLHNIENAEQMKQYYSTLVDDSLRNVLASEAREWGEYGWRGWSVRDGEFLWIDSLIYDIPYVSVRERVNLDSLRHKDILTLQPDLRDGWEPVAAYRGDDGEIVRIDAMKGKQQTDSNALRMLLYAKGMQLTGNPTRTALGSLDLEGSALTHSYRFTDNRGEIWTLETEPMDSSRPMIYYEGPDGTSSEMPITPVYWLDIVIGDSNTNTK